MVPFAKIFNIEIDGWIHGVSRYHGEFKDEMLFGIVRVLGPSVRRAIDEGISFDLVDIVIRFNKACRNMVGEVEILLAFLTNFPPPQTLKGDKRKTLLMTLSKVEQSYPGALALLEQNWRQQLGTTGQEMLQYDVAEESILKNYPEQTSPAWRQLEPDSTQGPSGREKDFRLDGEITNEVSLSAVNAGKPLSGRIIGKIPTKKELE